MSVVESAPPPRSGARGALFWVRRAHLYLGLFLMPWSALYGVTAFLFNHPGAFSEQATAGFGRAALKGTPMESPPSPAEVAAGVVEALNERAGGARYELVELGQARYTREFAFATVRTDDGEQVGLLFDPVGLGGTVRALPRLPKMKPAEPAPFAVGGRAPTALPPAPKEDRLRLPQPLHERVKGAVPVVLEKTGFSTGEVTVTSVPDLNFRMASDGETWSVTYNAMAGTVSGRRAEDEPRQTISTRRFLPRLHLAHGYPPSGGVRWAWALLVDVMAVALVFWGASGLLMWWQIKATRLLGAVVLVVSVAITAALAVGMYGMLTG